MAEGRRCCIWSRRHCFFCILVLAALLFFYSTNMKEMPTDWNPRQWIQDTAPKWWNQLRGPIRTESNTSSPGSTSELTTAAAGFTSANNSVVFPQTENITSTQVTNVTITNLTTNAPVVPTPAPYVSPGPYLVEYPSEYHFITNEPQKCEQQKPFLVLVVPVAPQNRAHRDIIRNSWGGESLILGRVVSLFFLLGLHTGEGGEQLKEQLLQESKEHQDLIQSDFVDCYKNLTIKTMVMLEWLDSYCSSASYAMKIDSDMFLNVPNLINMLISAPKTNYMTGLVARGGAVLRDPTSKWFLPVEIYPHSVYPRYALGLGYIFSLDLTKKLVEASRHVKAVYIEDVYLGLCMQHLGIPPTNPPDWGYFNVFPVPYSRCAYSRLIATTTQENVDRMWIWKDLKKPGRDCS
ncbi:beta-1,3-galactosyltransferase 1-like [Seriola dumerili]|uniref:Hexosyltransferase n=1 Tax=Seriola dumerili TaxID=41447 RepID=A0A3B4VAG4_SERDU|nr:beta-1,3-galactosyltransferase 1-like [Seriola dumerili]